MDAVQKVGNGHPGTAMSLAPAAYLLFQKVMRHDPADPDWVGRDRFVLSCGHSSLTLYIQLYLGGFGLELDDLKALRTWGSRTPGHPEHGHTAGVETTTGPLGQGVGNAVGMAMAARRERGLLDPDAAAGREPVRPPHLRDRLRRRHPGGRQRRGVLARRAPAARQPRRDLRRQQDLDRGRHRHRLQRGRRRRATRRTAGTCRTSTGPTAAATYAEDVAGAAATAIQAAERGHRPAELHQPAHDHRAGRRRTRRTPARPTAPRSATTRSRPPRRSSASTPSRPSRSPTTCSPTPAGWSSAARPRRRAGRQAFDAWAEADRRARALLDRMQHAARCPRAGPTRCRPSTPTQGRRDPQGLRRGAHRDRAGAARAVGRLGRPRRVQQHHAQGRAVVRARRSTRPRSSPATRTAASCTSASASTPWARS